MQEPPCYIIFHMNLAFSAIPVVARDEVIRRCYHPMLDLAEAGIPLGIECNAWTLEEIARRDNSWISRFKTLLEHGRCELIAGGYVQLIGPLVPQMVSLENQKLGLQVYDELLGIKPRLVMIGEMAFSHGHLAIYPQLGYRGIVLERDNIQLFSYGHVPAEMRLAGTGHPGLPVLWADTVLFQKFQRLIYGDIETDEYHEYLDRCLEREESLALYCSDAEIFDYRPKRYHYESDETAGEWDRIADLLQKMDQKLPLVLPSEVITTLEEGMGSFHNDCRAPILVKKQPKYNVARWAVSGRDDLALNTLCHRLTASMGENESPETLKRLCRLWSSDFRTHIHPERFERAMADLTQFLEERGLPVTTPLPDHGTPVEPEDLAGLGFQVTRSKLLLTIKTPAMKLRLNLRRGLTIQSLCFEKHDFKPCLGTLEQGFFEAIDLGADFYSGGIVIELPGELKRITDLEWVDPVFLVDGDKLSISVSIQTDVGQLSKTLSFHKNEPALTLRYDFPGWQRPFGTVRAGNITMRPEAFDLNGFLSLEVDNGGELERFELEKDCNHGMAVSSLISCTTGFGATTGKMTLFCPGNKGVVMTWDPTRCAAFPMLSHRYAEPWQFTRIMFSLSELDDTRKPGGNMMPFELKLEPL